MITNKCNSPVQPWFTHGHYGAHILRFLLHSSSQSCCLAAQAPTQAGFLQNQHSPEEKQKVNIKNRWMAGPDAVNSCKKEPVANTYPQLTGIPKTEYRWIFPGFFVVKQQWWCKISPSLFNLPQECHFPNSYCKIKPEGEWCSHCLTTTSLQGVEQYVCLTSQPFPTPLLPKQILLPFSLLRGKILSSNASQKLPGCQKSFKESLTFEETEWLTFHKIT